MWAAGDDPGLGILEPCADGLIVRQASLAGGLGRAAPPAGSARGGARSHAPERTCRSHAGGAALRSPPPNPQSPMAYSCRAHSHTAYTTLRGSSPALAA